MPLILHLRGVRPFAEPCCGGGALGAAPGIFSLRGVYAGDLSGGQNARELDHYGPADAHFDNPFAAVIRGRP